VAPESPWGFFQLVHEQPTRKDRLAFHVRSVEGERYGRTGWKPDWQATRTSYSGRVSCQVEIKKRSATLVIRGAAEGIPNLEQRITLHADTPMIDLSARFLKKDVRSPEALYFAFPLNGQLRQRPPTRLWSHPLLPRCPDGSDWQFQFREEAGSHPPGQKSVATGLAA
jgi:hypothetical protein